MTSAWEPAGTTRRPALFVNPRSGGGKADDAGLVARARERGIEVTVLHPGDDLAAFARAAVEDGADALGVAGGDGSLALVAAVALENGLPFVCVPAGTRNHFALDLGVDRRDLVGSLDAFTTGVERLIDIAEMNGRLFLNNVSIGIYGDAVGKSAYRDAKARVLLETAATTVGPGATATGLQLMDDAGRLFRDPAVVLVSNNAYSLDPPRLPGTRARLDSGRLGVIVLDKGRPGRTWSTTRLDVSAAAPLHVGIDGEAVDVSPPLRFVIRPAALRVRISANHAASLP